MADFTFQTDFKDKQLPDWSMHYYKQYYKGIEIFGGDLKVRFNHNGHITSLNGVLLPPKHLLSLDTEPYIAETEAIEITLKMVSLLHPDSEWSVEPSGLRIFKQWLNGYYTIDTLHLAHKIVVRSSHPETLGYEIFVDAHTGEIIFQASTIRNLMHRRIWELDWQTRKKYLAWDELTPRNATDEAERSLLLASKTVFTIFKNLIGYESYDKSGIMQMQYAPSISRCPNAFFEVTGAFVCPGMTGIDIIAHEFGHAYVSTYGGNLVYHGDSGALNEAFADIIGETTQLLLEVPRYYPPRSSRRCDFNTSDSLRWILGDQVTNAIPRVSTAGYVIGMRDMYNPTCYKHPSTTSDSTFICDPAIDNGGVHTNSGIPNQAYALFVDGGILNGISVDGVGLIKGFNVYIRALGSHTSTTNFIQHAMLLTQACNDFAQNGTVLIDPLTGKSSGELITLRDCAQLELAILATGLNKTVNCSEHISKTPSIFSSYPIVGSALVGGAKSFSAAWYGFNLYSAIENATVTELNYGIDVETETYTSGGYSIIRAEITSDEPLKPDIYSFKIEFLGQSFGPYSLQTWYPPSVVNLSVSEVKSHTATWIELEVQDTVREFAGCSVGGKSPSIDGDCLRCVFQYATTAGFRIDDYHVGCYTPSFVPSNVTLNVGLWLTHGEGGQRTQKLRFVESLDHHSDSPISTPISTPISPPISSPISTPTDTPISPPRTFDIRPWVAGALAMVLSAVIAVLITSLVCAKRYAKREVFETL